MQKLYACLLLLEYLQLIKDKEQGHMAEVFTWDSIGNKLTGSKEKLNHTYNQGNQLTELTKLSPPFEIVELCLPAL